MARNVIVYIGFKTPEDITGFVRAVFNAVYKDTMYVSVPDMEGIAFTDGQKVDRNKTYPDYDDHLLYNQHLLGNRSKAKLADAFRRTAFYRIGGKPNVYRKPEQVIKRFNKLRNKHKLFNELKAMHHE